MTSNTNPVTQQELAMVLLFFSIEIMGAISPSSRIADERLENVANGLLGQVNSMPESPVRDVLSALVKGLIQTEGPA